MKRVTPRKLRDRRGGTLSPYARYKKRPFQYGGNLMVPFTSLSAVDREAIQNAKPRGRNGR